MDLNVVTTKGQGQQTICNFKIGNRKLSDQNEKIIQNKFVVLFPLKKLIQLKTFF